MLQKITEGFFALLDIWELFYFFIGVVLHELIRCK